MMEKLKHRGRKHQNLIRQVARRLRISRNKILKRNFNKIENTLIKSKETQNNLALTTLKNINKNINEKQSQILRKNSPKNQ